MYNSASYSQQEQQQQPQYEQPQHPAMAYNSTLQVPMMFGMSSSIQSYSNHNNQTNSINLGCEQNYFQGINMPMSQNISNCNSNNNNNHTHQPPSLISIRRDSGFAPSLDELSLGIMAANQQDREDFKGVLHTLQTASELQSNMMSSEIIGDNCSPSFFLSTPTSPSSSSSSSSPTSAVISNTGAASVTPVVPSMPFGIDYPLANEQHQLLQQQQSPMVTETPSSQYIGFQSTVVTDVQPSPSSPCTSSSWNTDFSMMATQQQQQQPALLSPLQYHPRQGQIQRLRQRKPMLQIMTNAASEQAMMFNSSLSPMSGPWESSCDNNNSLAVPSSGAAPIIASPSMSAANNIVRAGQYQQQQQPQQQSSCPWGFVSSPVESCFSSGSSTPLFASPSTSYAHSEMAASCQSSRATSPSFAPSSLYDNFLANERRIKRMDKDSSNLIIRSRKSSTSSTSSMVSQRRASTLRESALVPSSTATNNNGCSTPAPSSSATSSSSTGTHQCPKCLQRFAGPAVLVRHIESIHDKLLWNCVGCKSNLSRRDAVTRHINLSPMDSICRAVGTIGQIKTSNGAEIHYEISSYRAKPLDEVMNRMGKKISTTLRNEIDRSKAAAAMQQQQQQIHQQQQQHQQYIPYQHQHHYHAMMHQQQQEMCDVEMLQEQDEEDEMSKKRRRSSLVVDESLLARKKKMY
ncbi:hypothetical protein BGZ95_007010 [Linnemannia exigua]|uniref:C2H2-type domain-containing protein n=1 Tax=Linnemannia exigua TaxID=604196 RepID=A0AAD4DHA0_9FUNG|nr:hypothetical protein BGZ95_007010 [Linnemannia exigua]